MPNQNQRAPYAPQTVRQEMGGKQSVLPRSSVVTSLAPTLFDRSWQVGGSFAQIIAVTIGNLGANATAIVKVPVINLSPTTSPAGTGTVSAPSVPYFPGIIQLGPAQVAAVVVSVSLAPIGSAAPVAVPFIGMPYVQVAFQQGTASAATLSNLGSLVILYGAATYRMPNLAISLPVFGTAAGSSATVVNLSVSALLLGTAS